jgi:hypothetical protein
MCHTASHVLYTAQDMHLLHIWPFIPPLPSSLFMCAVYANYSSFSYGLFSSCWVEGLSEDLSSSNPSLSQCHIPDLAYLSYHISGLASLPLLVGILSNLSSGHSSVPSLLSLSYFAIPHLLLICILFLSLFWLNSCRYTTSGLYPACLSIFCVHCYKT